MSNKTLAFWIFIGLALVVALVRSYVLAQKRKEETEQLATEVLYLKQQNGMLLTENLNLKNGIG